MNSLLSLFRKSFIVGVGLSAGIATTLLVGGTITGTMHTFIVGQPISSSQINENFETLRGSLVAINEVPTGTIVAWHKSLTGTPNLPSGWVECNGQTISDAASAYNGQTVPDLNSDTGSGQGGRFLRGNTVSGTLQTDAFQGHRHQVSAWTSAGGASLTGLDGNTINGSVAMSFSSSILDPITDGSNGTPRTSNETRPANMSVVWIIKIK